MPDYGATPKARAQRIRAAILYPFWQDAFYRIEAAGHPDKRPEKLAKAQMLAIEILLRSQDREDLFERTLASSEYLAQGLENEEPGPLPALIRKALPPREKVAKPGTPTAFLYGAFREWLRHEGVEVQMFRDAGAVEVAIVGPDAGGGPVAKARTFSPDQIPARARSAGRAAVRQMIKEIGATNAMSREGGEAVP